MKNTLILGIAIVIGFIAHALLTNPEKCVRENKTKKSASYGDYKDIREYGAVAKLKQSAVDQLSDLQAKKMTLNGQDYLYIFLLDEKENGKGVNWEHKLYTIKNDSMVQVPIE